MDFSVRTEAVGSDDQSWLRTSHGTNDARTVTFDKSTFAAGTHYPQGFLKSGIPVAKITATGKYGPYDDTATDGRQTLVGLVFVAVSVPTADSDPIGTVLDHAQVVETKLPIAIDAAGKADVAGRIIFA